MPGKSCVNQIFVLGKITEKYLSVGKAFTAQRKLIYYLVNRTILWKVLNRYRLSGKLPNCVKAVYAGCRACKWAHV